MGESQASDEQYLTGHGESSGRWYGAGASSLGLEGEASPSGFRRMFEGRDPDTGELLGRPHGRNANRVQGPEGRWTALGGRDLYRHRLAVDAIYRASYQASTFARQDVIAAIGGQLAGAARADLEGLADRFLADRPPPRPMRRAGRPLRGPSRRR